MPLLSRETIIDAFDHLNGQLAARQVHAELFLVGGAVMCLVHEARPTTKDVDGWFTEPRTVREAAKAVAEELNLPEDWLNDAAKGFVPPNAGYETWREMSNLTISTVDIRTLLAMKCAASRTDADVDDIRTLSARMGLMTAADVLSVVGEYFSENRLPVRTQLLLEEMFDDDRS